MRSFPSTAMHNYVRFTQSQFTKPQIYIFTYFAHTTYQIFLIDNSNNTIVRYYYSYYSVDAVITIYQRIAVSINSPNLKVLRKPTSIDNIK